jgi:putative endonuclease
MFYTYVLLSIKSNRLYVGYTENLKERLKEHNSGQGGSYSEKNKPFILIYYEAFLAKSDAIVQEKFYKSGYGREVLNGKIINSLTISRH